MLWFVWLGLATEKDGHLSRPCHTYNSEKYYERYKMKHIDISTPKFPSTFTFVDDEDFHELNKHKWHPAKEASGMIYVKRNIGFGIKQRMHIAILGQIEGKMIDHRNRNGLDNQRHNLRYCSNAENQRNRGAQRNNKSGYKGVSWYKGSDRWVAQIKCDGVKLHLGYFTCLVKAAKAYDKAAKLHFGGFASLNFPAAICKLEGNK
jgi:hypothetical protein